MKSATLNETAEAPQMPKYRDTASTLADHFNVHERSIYNWFDRGVIPGFRIGKTVRFNLAEVVAKLEGGAR